MGNPRSPTPASPPPPNSVDAGQAIASYLGSISDPALQQNLWNLESTYRPQYTALNQRDIQNTLLGVDPGTPNGFYGTLDMQDMAGQRQQQTYQGLQGQQNQFNIGQLAQYGPQAYSAYMAANPGLASAIGRAEGLAGQGGQAGTYGAMNTFLGQSPATNQVGQPINPQSVTFNNIQSGGTLSPQQVAAQQVAAGSVNTSDINSGALGSQLYAQALQANQQSPLTGALGAQGLRMATNPGQLTPEEIRAATQGSREKYADAGRINDNVSVADEALARAAASRDRQYQDLAAAQGINSQQLGAQQMGQQFATGVLGQDYGKQQFNIANRLGADQFNVGTGLQASLANQDAGLRAALANQTASMEAGRFNILNSQNVQAQNQAAQLQAGIANQGTNLQGQLANLGAAQYGQDFNTAQQQQYFQNLGQYALLGQQQNSLDRNYAMGLTGLYGGAANATMGLLGQTPAGMGYGTQQQQLGMQQAGTNMGPSLFDPNAGVNLALQNNANLANYNASIYGAQAGLAGANAQATGAYKGALIQGGMQAAGSIIGGAIACWVARECFGPTNPQWLQFREWLLTKAPTRRRERYLVHGPMIAEWLSKRPDWKERIRRWMLTKIAVAA